MIIKNECAVLAPVAPVPVPEEEPKKPGKFKIFLLKIGKRNVMITGAVLLIGAAVALNWYLFSGENAEGGYQGYERPSGSVITDDTPVVDEISAYFSATQVSRQRARDEAIEVLQTVVDNPESADTAKSDALAGISAIAEEIQLEADIESLITAKGFSNCVTVLNGDNATVVVKADDLLPADIAQINAIVYEKAGILPSGINIIKK